MSSCKRVGLAATVLMLGALQGCTTVYEGRYDWQDGWREAQVLQVASAYGIKHERFSDCRATVSPEERASSRFAVLLYMHMARSRHRVVPLPTGDTFAKGEFVYMNLRSCHTPLVRRNAPLGGHGHQGHRLGDAGRQADCGRPLPAEVRAAR